MRSPINVASGAEHHTRSRRYSSSMCLHARKQAMRLAYPCAGAGTFALIEALYKPECFRETQWHCRPQEIDK